MIDADPYLKYLPSVVAGAAFHLALYTVTGQSWVRMYYDVFTATLPLTCLCHIKFSNCRVPADGCLDILTWKNCSTIYIVRYKAQVLLGFERRA